MRTREYIALIIAGFAAIPLLGVACVVTPELIRGEIAGQLMWLSKSYVLFFLSSLLALIVGGKKLRLHFSYPDLLFSIFCIIWIVSYYRTQKPNPENVIFFAQLASLWFILRIMLKVYPVLYKVFIGVIVFFSGIEAIWGLKQIYGFAQSNHPLFVMTGSFFNPGPYSGYLAMALPLCIDQLFIYKKNRNSIESIYYYLLLVITLSICCVLPAGMSRSAWIASIFSCGWIISIHLGWKQLLTKFYRKNIKRFILFTVAGTILLVILLTATFNLKKESANGRLFMWKISLKAIYEKPFTGYGQNKFPAAYADAQKNYFKKGDYSKQEELVAGSPEYAFNEYLQLVIEGGIFALISFMSFIIFCLYKGIKNKQAGICGAILSLIIFAFSSYPFQLPVFPVTLLFLLAICVQEKDIAYNKPNMFSSVITYSMCIALCICTYKCYLFQRKSYPAYQKWAECEILYRMESYNIAEKEYERIYEVLKYRPNFLFEYGHCLYKLNKWKESIRILKEAAKLSNDPMILNILGKNYQQLGNYLKAEEYLKNSTYMLPGRIYPYYLLAKLYADPRFYNPKKMKKMVEIVLTKEPKVQSTAIREIREEMKNMIK